MSSFFQKAVQGQMPVHIFSCKKMSPGNTARVAKKAHAKQNAERFLNVCHMDHLLTYPMSMFSHLYPVHTDGTIFRSAAYFLKRHVQSF